MFVLPTLTLKHCQLPRCTDCPLFDNEDQLTDAELEELVNMADYADTGRLTAATDQLVEPILQTNSNL